MTRFAIIVNPVSGRGGALAVAEELRATLSTRADVAVLETTGRGSATELAAATVGDFDRVVAVGGDGTLNEVLNGLVASGTSSEVLPALGYLPGGTANVAALAFGFERRPGPAADRMLASEGVPVDVGFVDHTWGTRAFLLWMGAGWDAVVIHALNASRTGHMGVLGLAGNVPRVLDALQRYPDPPIRARTADDDLGEYATVIAANVGLVAFGGMVHEGADARDGLLDIVGLPAATTVGRLGLGYHLVTAGLSRSRGALHVAGTEVSLDSTGDVPFQVDGEPLGNLPVRVRLRPRGIRLLGG